MNICPECRNPYAAIGGTTVCQCPTKQKYIVHPNVATLLRERGLWNDERWAEGMPIEETDEVVTFFRDEQPMDRRQIMNQEPKAELITDFMLDLETFGTGPNAVIVGIGLAGFNIETGLITPMLDLTIDPQSCLDKGLTVDGDTILWWTRQSDAARAKLNTDKITLQEALFEVTDCMRGETVLLDDKGGSAARVWGNGSTFDNVILSSAFKACGMQTPWAFWADRDVRTTRDLAVMLGCEDFKKTLEFEGTAHCALDDAIHQAKCVCSYYRFLKGGCQ